jgi:acetoin utilization protein AcuB
MIVKEIMKKSLITISGNETILDACNKYRDCKIGCLIVIDEEQVIGIVTERDLIERTICIGRDPKKTKIKEIMTNDVITIDPFDRIEKALEIIKKNKIKKLPVVSNDKLVGIVTITDIAYTKSVIKEFLELHKF